MCLDTIALLPENAPAPFTVMLAYLRSAKEFAFPLFTVVGADAGAPAVFAPTSTVIVEHFFSSGRGMSCFTALPTITCHRCCPAKCISKDATRCQSMY